MKIKVSFEKIFDSDEFYMGAPLEDLEDLNFESFIDGIEQDLCEYTWENLEYNLKYELIEEKEK